MSSSTTRYAVTGHQLGALGGTQQTSALLRQLADEWVARTRPAELITGLAIGWDMAVTEAALAAGIPFVAVLAYPEQGEYWSEDVRIHLKSMLDKAAQIHVMGERKSDGMWTRRDHWLIDRADAVVALWAGNPGGTKTAITYARGAGKPVENLWPEWESLLDGQQAA